MNTALRTRYVNGSYAGKVEYAYSLILAGARTERIQYDASNNVTSWRRYEVDGLLTYRVDERYDSDEDGLDSADPWRVVEKRTYGPGPIGNLLFKEVLKYPDPTADLNPDDRVYCYGYDAVGNVILITEEYCGGTAYKYCFHQDAFGNEISEGWFEGASWSEAESAGIREHQTGKEYDSFTGLYYYHFRWYDPVVGRFTSRTPLLPWQESAYAYCENDPVDLVDLNGLVVETAVDIGFFVYDVATGNWVDVGVDVIAMLIPGVPNLSKIDDMCDVAKKLKSTKIFRNAPPRIMPYNEARIYTRGLHGEIHAHKIAEARHLRYWGKVDEIGSSPSVLLWRDTHLDITTHLRRLLPYSTNDLIRRYRPSEVWRTYLEAYAEHPLWIKEIGCLR